MANQKLLFDAEAIFCQVKVHKILIPPGQFSGNETIKVFVGDFNKLYKNIAATLVIDRFSPSEVPCFENCLDLASSY